MTWELYTTLQQKAALLILDKVKKMNLCDYYVIKVTSKPKFEEYDDVSWWSVNVEYESDCGSIKETELSYETKEQCEAVKFGHKFML